MWTRWRIAGYVLAAIMFVATLLNPGTFFPGPPVVQAIVAAVSVMIAVWLYEGIFIAGRWVWRKLAS